MKKNYLFLVLLLWIGVTGVKAQEATVIDVKTGDDFIAAFSEENKNTNIILEIQDNIILTKDISITGKTVIIRGPEKKNPEELYSISYNNREEKTITLENATVTVENLFFPGSPDRDMDKHSSARAFSLNSTSSLTINGCTFEHYYGDMSCGVIQNNGGRLILKDCSFSNNTSYYRGGAIRNDGGTVVATDCKFTKHNSGSSKGVVLYSTSGSICFTNCIITKGEDHNLRSFFFLESTKTEFIGCLIKGGTEAIISDGELTLQDCIISESAGGVVCSNTLLIDQCIFKDNTDTLVSTETTDEEETPTQIIRNSLFVNNSIEWGNPEDIDFYGLIEYRGGANADPLTIANCTFTDNTIGGNSVFFKYTQEREGLGPHFYNTILDIPEENAFGFAYNGEDEGGTPPTLNDLVFQNCLTNLESLGGNAANKDNQVRVTNFGFAGEGNYSLIDESPAIDAGNNDLYKAIGGDLYKDVDLTGEQLRWLGKSIDIGAYESFGETPTPPSDTTFHNLTLEVAPGIELYNLSAGEHLVEAGGHLHLQFLPEDRTLGADDILLLIDGVETEFKDFGANLYFSYILNPVKQNHSVVIALREYTVTLPEVQGITYDVGAGMHRVAYGNSFTFRLTLADEIDPADVHVFANGQEISPTNLPQGEALRSEAREGASLSYTIDRVTTPVIVRIEGGSTTSNASLTQGVRLAIDNGQLTIDNEMANAVDVAIYSITGQNMVQLRGLRGSRTLTLPAGIYIVRAGQQSWKVIING